MKLQQVYKKNNFITFIIIFIIVSLIMIACKEKNNDEAITKEKNVATETIEKEVIEHNVNEPEQLEEFDTYVYDQSEVDSTVDTFNSEYKEVNFVIDTTANSRKNKISGRRINIAVVGMDARVGTASKHADANHLISVFPESGHIEITSIPRDTYCDLGYEDSTGLNKLTICRSNKGRTRYLQELARIAKVDKVNYYMEFGFSQAMGIIELLGYKNPTNTLQVLRTRKGFGDDYQRCYNQGQFIRQALLKHFNKFTGTFGSIFIRAGLLLVETNLTYDVVSDIVNKLESLNFPKSNDVVTVRVRPVLGIKYKNYDFSDEDNINNLVSKIEKFNKSRYKGELDAPQPKVNVEKRLNSIIAQAVKDSAKRPEQVINRMKNYFNQRAWYQVKDKEARIKIRNEFGTLLYNAYLKKNRLNEAANVKEVIESDKVLFDNK